MLDNTVTFVYNGYLEIRIFICDFVKKRIELEGGQVYEDIDFNLSEQYTGARLIIDLAVLITSSSDEDWMMNFLKASDKRLIVSGGTYQVVNTASKFEYDLYKGSSEIGAYVPMKFAVKYIQ